MSKNIKIEYLWRDRKRHFGLPLSFTTYSISDDRLFIKTGMLNERQEETLLYLVIVWEIYWAAKYTKKLKSVLFQILCKRTFMV